MKLRCRILSVFIILCIVTILLTGCAKEKKEVSITKDKIRIAKQFGLVYAPLMIAEKNNLFEKYDLEVEWMTLGSGGAVREALTAGQLDAAFMGIPPFLIGWDKGVPAKIAAGYAVVPVSLVTYDPDIKDIGDFKPEHKIALPSPGSIQHILLSMGLEKKGLDPKFLDENIVALPHPDGAQALQAKKDVIAHFTTPPYLFEELSWPGYREILDGFEAFGTDFNFNVALVTEKYRKENPRGYASFIMGLNEAMDWVNQNRRETAKLLAPEFNIEEEKLFEYLKADKVNFTTSPYGLMGFAEFMQKAGYISKVPQNLSEIAWENILAQVGARQGGISELEKLQSSK